MVTKQYDFQEMARKSVPEPPNQLNVKKAQAWYKDVSNGVGSKIPGKVMTNISNLTSVISIGKMYLFYYDPKTKETLPYWDQFPLIFPIQMYKDGFLGINLHYVQPLVRAKIMKSLYDLTSNKKMNDNTKLQISYKILSNLSRYSMIKPCIKRYLFNHVRSRYFYITPENWDLALMLPTEQFQKATKNKVFKDSRGNF